MIGKLSCVGAARRQSVLEEFQDFVAGCDRRLTSFVYEVGSHDTMRV